MKPQTATAVLKLTTPLLPRAGQIWRKLHEPVYPITYLQRSNRGVIKKTFELMTKEAEEKTGRTIRVLGGVKKLNFQQIVELFLMKNFPPVGGAV